MTHELARRRDGAIEVLTLNKPARRNALSRPLIDALRGAIDDVLADDAIGGVVLTGASPAFSAGLDLAEVAAIRGDEARCDQVALALFDLLTTIDDAPKPIVAAVNGAAVAGGAALAGVCDVAIAARSAVVGYPAIRRGVVATVVMPFAVERVGLRRARYLLLTGELLSASDAKAAGLVDEVVDDVDVVPRAFALAKRMASFSGSAYVETKRGIRSIESQSPGEGHARYRASCARLNITDDPRRAT